MLDDTPIKTLLDAADLLSRMRRFPGQQTAFDIETLVDRCLYAARELGWQPPPSPPTLLVMLLLPDDQKDPA